MKLHRQVCNAALIVFTLASGTALAEYPLGFTEIGGIGPVPEHTFKLTHPESNLPHGDVALKYAANRATGGTEVLVNVKDIPECGVNSRHVYVVPFENGAWSTSPIEIRSTGHYDHYSIYAYTGTRRFSAFYIRDDKQFFDYDQGQCISYSTIDDVSGLAYTLANIDSRTGNNVKACDIRAVRNITVSCWGGRSCHCSDPSSSIQLSGNIFVQNLSYDKRVAVHFGINGHFSTNATDLSAYFAEGTSGYDQNGVPIGVERWHFDGKLTGSTNVDASAVEVALYHTNLRNGVTYWDNNFEYNYQIAVSTKINCTGDCCSSRY
jgi:hypothetical protein